MTKLETVCRKTNGRLIEEKQRHVQHVVSLHFDIRLLEQEREELSSEIKRLTAVNDLAEEQKL